MAILCATVSLVMDRLYAINQTISDVNAARYYPQNLDSATLPLLVAVPRNATYSRDQKGREAVTITRNYFLELWIRYFESGIPTQSAQTDAENLIDAIYETYYQRPRLNTDSDTSPLDNVLRGAAITEDTGIIQAGQNIATVRFTLQVDTFQIIREQK